MINSQKPKNNHITEVILLQLSAMEKTFNGEIRF